MPAYEFDYIKNEVKEIIRQVPNLTSDDAFIAWFLRAFFTDDLELALKSLIGGANDKNIDGVLIDQEARTVFIVQGKYRQADKPPNENRSDLMTFADYARILTGPAPELKKILDSANPLVQEALERARQLIVRSQFRVGLLFVTTGKVSKAHEKEAEERVTPYDSATLQIFDRGAILRLLADYVEGAAPPVPRLRLPILENSELMRFDPTLKTTSYIFAMSGKEIGRLYKIAGRRLFARNIRGFLGNTGINIGMRQTLKDHPEYFWYFNNGVTVICDDVDPETIQGKKYLSVTNPQVINGQQTTRSLGEDGTDDAAVLVKLIAVSRQTDEGREHYGHLVSKIVSATNFQNEITLSDLRANDAEQVRIERELRKWNVLYIRKRQSKSELRRIHGAKYKLTITKEDLARAIAGSLLDPSILRKGKENLFDEINYLKIFNERPILEYLAFYWLNRAVKWRKATSEQGYARWLVLNFMWHQIGDQLRRPAFADWFQRSMRQFNDHENTLWQLLRAIDVVMVVAIQFYRESPSTKSGHLDASSFFRYTKLHTEFKKYWASRKNSRRREKMETYLDTFLERAKAEIL